jgi:hypothetical protein
MSEKKSIFRRGKARAFGRFIRNLLILAVVCAVGWYFLRYFNYGKTPAVQPTPAPLATSVSTPAPTSAPTPAPTPRPTLEIISTPAELQIAQPAELDAPVPAEAGKYACEISEFNALSVNGQPAIVARGTVSTGDLNVGEGIVYLAITRYNAQGISEQYFPVSYPAEGKAFECCVELSGFEDGNYVLSLVLEAEFADQPLRLNPTRPRGFVLEDGALVK